MSERSYRRNRALGVAGPNTSTCLVSAFDRITPEAGVSAYTYNQYRRVMRLWDNRPSADLNPNKHNGIYRELYDLIASDLGGLACSDIVFERALKPQRLARIIDQLFEDGFRPTIDIHAKTGPHSVGVQQIDEGLYWLVGYGIPTPLRNQPVTATDIEPFHMNPGTAQHSR